MPQALRDAVLAQNTAPALCRAVMGPAHTPEHLLSVYGFVVRGIVVGRERPPFAVSSAFLPLLARLLGLAPEVPLEALNVSAEDAMWAISDVVSDPSALGPLAASAPALLPRAVALCLRAKSKSLVHAALRFLGNTAAGGEAAVQRLLDAGGLPAIVTFLALPPPQPPSLKPQRHFLHWRVEALWSLSHIALSHKQAILDAGAVGLVLDVLRGGGRSGREHACWAIVSLLTDCTGPQKDAVVALGAAQVVCAALAAWVRDEKRERSLDTIAVDALWELRRPVGSTAGVQLLVDAGAPGVLEALLDFWVAGENVQPRIARAMARAERMLLVMPGGAAARRVFFAPLAPAEQAARAASCLECWIAAPRRPCAHRAQAEPCAICMDVSAGGGESLALQCGHVLHTACVLPWLVHNTREGGRTRLWKRGVCPVCRKVATRVVRVGGEGAEGISAFWVDITSDGASFESAHWEEGEEGEEEEGEGEGEGEEGA